MQNAKLNRLVEYLALPQDIETSFSISKNIKRMSIDTRDLDSSSIFVALFGHKSNGHDYITQACELGCELILADTKNPSQDKQIETMGGSNAICLYVYNLRAHLPAICHLFYIGKTGSSEAQESKSTFKPHIVAVTGTNGKTSVANISAQLNSLCGNKSASIGTLGVMMFDGDKNLNISSTSNTTPDLITIYNLIDKLTELGCSQIFIEASSHGIDQERLARLPIHCATFTNLTQDHLDYHITMSAYAKAKRKLILQPSMQHLILNADDSESQNWAEEARPLQSVFYFSVNKLSQKQRGCWASAPEYSAQGVEFTLHHNIGLANKAVIDDSGYESIKIKAPLIGHFNIANILASVCTLLVQGVSLEAIAKHIPQISGVAGRMELFLTSKASLLVDYAHTPDALAQALIAARAHTSKELSCVFGCGGERDKGKRSQMGEVAQRYADQIVLTQDNTRTENPKHIIDDICKGITADFGKENLSIELDRELAVINAWQKSKSGDLILLAGKGHEDYVELNGQKHHYDERALAATISSDNRNPIRITQASIWQNQERVSL